MYLNEFQEKFPVLIKALSSAKKSERLSHAYLVYGDNFELREKFALLLSQFIACKTPTKEFLPCESCEICSKLQNKTYPELFMLEATSKRREITIGKINDPDTMRWFENQFYLSSTGIAGIKIGIIWDADCMNPQSQNAFLKTLEEPPRNTSFILTTEKPNALLPTTRSRCQCIQILNNKIQYNIAYKESLCDALFSLLKQPLTINDAEQAMTNIMSVSTGLKDEALNIITTKMKDQLDRADAIENPKDPYKKYIATKYEATIQSEYLKLRSEFLSLINTFYSQLYHIIIGADKKYIANYNIIQKYEQEFNILDEKILADVITRTENLLKSLNTNVKEDLTMRNFCMSFLRRI